MTPKQKRALERLAVRVRALHDYTCTVDGPYVTALALGMDLRVLAAEGPPRCVSCNHARPAAAGSMFCDNWRLPSLDVVRADFGCVQHSDYESECE
jgi:hypothetical protein